MCKDCGSFLRQGTVAKSGPRSRSLGLSWNGEEILVSGSRFSSVLLSKQPYLGVSFMQQQLFSSILIAEIENSQIFNFQSVFFLADVKTVDNVENDGWEYLG